MNAEEGAPQSGQRDVGRCEVTRTSTSSFVSLIEVISRPSGSGNSGVAGIPCYLFSKEGGVYVLGLREKVVSGVLEAKDGQLGRK